MRGGGGVYGGVSAERGCSVSWGMTCRWLWDMGTSIRTLTSALRPDVRAMRSGPDPQLLARVQKSERPNAGLHCTVAALRRSGPVCTGGAGRALRRAQSAPPPPARCPVVKGQGRAAREMLRERPPQYRAQRPQGIREHQAGSGWTMKSKEIRRGRAGQERGRGALKSRAGQQRGGGGGQQGGSAGHCIERQGSAG